MSDFGDVRMKGCMDQPNAIIMAPQLFQSQFFNRVIIRLIRGRFNKASAPTRACQCDHYIVER